MQLTTQDTESVEQCGGKKSSIMDMLTLTCLCAAQVITFRAENLHLKRDVFYEYFIKLLMPTSVTREFEVAYKKHKERSGEIKTQRQGKCTFLEGLYRLEQKVKTLEIKIQGSLAYGLELKLLSSRSGEHGKGERRAVCAWDRCEGSLRRGKQGFILAMGKGMDAGKLRAVYKHVGNFKPISSGL